MMRKPVQIMVPELTPEEERGLRAEWEKGPAGITGLRLQPRAKSNPRPAVAGLRFSSAAGRATISGRNTSGLTKIKGSNPRHGYETARMIRGESRGELGGLNLLAFT
jgi:hypothetical protein